MRAGSWSRRAFARWRDRGRFFAIPGNHDLYLFPIASSARPRPTHESKRARWREVAARAGLELEPCGAWKRVIAEADAIVVGLDSLLAQAARLLPSERRHRPRPARVAPRRSARRASGRARGTRSSSFTTTSCRCPIGVGKRAPTEIGMRLDDGRAFADTLAEVGATLVMHGHRHVSERRNPAGYDFELLAAPSLTLGLQERRRALVLAGGARPTRACRAGAYPGRGDGAGERSGNGAAAAARLRDGPRLARGYSGAASLAASPPSAASSASASSPAST